MNGFYLGCDVSCLEYEGIKLAIKGLFDTGLFAAGYSTLRTGRRTSADISALNELRTQGFTLDLTVDSSDDLVLVSAVHAQAATVDGFDHVKAETLISALRENGVERISIRIEQDKDFAWAAKLADVVDIECVNADDDFYAITRNRMDSCYDEDVDPAHSETAKRKAVLQSGGRYQIGTLPLHFDDERNIAIFQMAVMLGSPLVLDAQTGSLSAKLLAVLKNQVLIQVARQGVGQVVRYYDPWHVLLGKSGQRNQQYMMILNRCHGDMEKTDINGSDLGWEGAWSVTNLRTGVQESYGSVFFNAHVETSDHPLTPCCQLYLLNKHA